MLFRSSSGGGLKLAGSDRLGFFIVDASADAFVGTQYLMDAADVHVSYYQKPDVARGKMFTVRFTVRNGTLT